MAAKTPSTISQENTGSLNLIKVVFTDLDDGDTWASGLSNVWGKYFNRTDQGTNFSANAAVTESAGTFTFYCSEANNTGELYVYVKQ